MLTIMFLSAALSTARPAIRPLAVNFDIASLDRSYLERGRKRWLPPRVDALPEDGDGPPLFRFKGTKVRLKVPL